MIRTTVTMSPTGPSDRLSLATNTASIARTRRSHTAVDETLTRSP
jgi:hypothetical protein